MTTLQMVSEARLLLDEVGISDGMWSDDDIYIALSTGQKEVANFLVQEYRKIGEINQGKTNEYLMSLVTKLTGKATVGTGVYSLGLAKILILLRAKYGSNQEQMYPAIIKDYGKEFDFEDFNTFLSPIAEEPVVALMSSYNTDGTLSSGEQRLEFHPEPVSSSYGIFNVTAIKQPKDINASTEPEIHEATHTAVVQRAFVELLIKAERPIGDQMEIYKAMLGGLL